MGYTCGGTTAFPKVFNRLILLQSLQTFEATQLFGGFDLVGVAAGGGSGAVGITEGEARHEVDHTIRRISVRRLPKAAKAVLTGRR